MSGQDNFLVCPHCKQRTRSAVIDSRGNKEGGWIRRRRACPCGQRYTTIETALGVDTPRPDVNVKAVREAVDMLLVRMLT